MNQYILGLLTALNSSKNKKETQIFSCNVTLLFILVECGRDTSKPNIIIVLADDLGNNKTQPLIVRFRTRIFFMYEWIYVLLKQEKPEMDDFERKKNFISREKLL